MKNYDWLTNRTPRSVEQMRLWRDNPRLNPDFDYITLQNFAEGICGDKGDRDSFIELVESIVVHGFIPADPIVVWQNPDNEKFYVAEGNRRILALKLLIDPHKSPISIRAKITTLSKKIILDNLDNYRKIMVAVAPTFADAEWYIFQRHSTAALQRSWSREQQFRYVAKIFAEENCDVKNTQARTRLPLSEIYSVIRTIKLKDYCLKLESNFSKQEFDDLKSYQFPLSTFERFLEDSNIVEKMRIKYENENVYIEAKPEDFNNSLLTLVKRIVSHGKEKISSRTSMDTVKTLLPEIKTTAERWSLIDNAHFKSATTDKNKKSLPKPSPSTGEINNVKRLKVIPKECNLNSSNQRLSGIWTELKIMPTSRYCNISAAALRIFLDLSVKEFLDAQNLVSDIETTTKSKIRDISLKKRLEYLKNMQSLPNHLKTDIFKLLNPENDFSLDVLNGYIHSSKTYCVGPEFLNRFWDFLFPFFCHVLEISIQKGDEEENE